MNSCTSIACTQVGYTCTVVSIVYCKVYKDRLYLTGRALIIFYVQCSHGAVSVEYETGRALIIFYVQCSHGAVSGEYETGRALMNAGVIPSSDITPEAALTKLSYVLAKVKCSY